MRPFFMISDLWVVAIVSAIFFVSSCKKQSSDSDFIPGDLIVGFKDTTEIQTAFNIMNKNGLEIDIVSGFTYDIPYPADSVDMLITFFNEKEYINLGLTRTQSKATTSNIFYSTNSSCIVFKCIMYEMDFVDQMDFVDALIGKKMTDRNSKSKYFLLKVTQGKETYWLDELKQEQCVEWVELNRDAGLDQ